MQELMNRFKEPSSYAALSAVFAMLGIMVPTDLWQSVVRFVVVLLEQLVSSLERRKTNCVLGSIKTKV